MSSALLSTRSLSVQIGTCRVVESLDLEVEAGQFWGILGPNGVGKTTLLKTLAGVHPPAGGSVRLGNQPLASLSRRAIARRLGMLMQNTQYAFDARCEQTALVGRHPHLKPWSRESRTDRALARQALSDVGLGELSERSCMDLSGGESRRLALATLLVQDPAVLLLDEPTNHLDPANQVGILDVLVGKVRDRQKAAVMALHEVNLATCYCSHALMLFGDGRWEAGPTQELLNEDNLSRLYRCPMRLVDDGRQRVFAVAASP